MILWFCWYGFNTGSVYHITGKDHATLAQNAAVSTTLAASSGALSALLAKLWITERETGEPVYSLSDTLMGCLAGLVSITGSCAFIQAWAAIIIGLFSGLVYLSGSRLLIRLGIDDAVDAVSISRDTFQHDMMIQAPISLVLRHRRFYVEIDPNPHVLWNVGCYQCRAVCRSQVPHDDSPRIKLSGPVLLEWQSYLMSDCRNLLCSWLGNIYNDTFFRCLALCRMASVSVLS